MRADEVPAAARLRHEPPPLPAGAVVYVGGDCLCRGRLSMSGAIVYMARGVVATNQTRPIVHNDAPTPTANPRPLGAASAVSGAAFLAFPSTSTRDGSKLLGRGRGCGAVTIRAAYWAASASSVCSTSEGVGSAAISVARACACWAYCELERISRQPAAIISPGS